MELIESYDALFMMSVKNIAFSMMVTTLNLSLTEDSAGKFAMSVVAANQISFWAGMIYNLIWVKITGFSLFFRWGMWWTWITIPMTAIAGVAPLFLKVNKFVWAVNAAGFFYGMKPFWETRGDMREYLAMQDEIEDFQEYYEDDEE